MSDREPPNPGVSVFHFTSKVSNAKIRKYVQATGRGMNPPQAASKQAPTTSPAPASSNSNTDGIHEADSVSRQESPPKKRKLKINGPRGSPMTNIDAPKDEGENIAVARPKRNTTAPARYADDLAFATSEDDEHNVLNVPSPVASSDLSSLESAATPATEEKKTAKSAAFEEYNNFAQFYILDDDKEDSPAAVSDKSEQVDEAVSDTTPDLVPEPAKPKKATKGSKQPAKVAKQPHPRKKRQSQRTQQENEEPDLETTERLETQQQQNEQQPTQQPTQQPKQRAKRGTKDPAKQRTKQQIRQQIEQGARAQGADTNVESQRAAPGYEGPMQPQYYPLQPGMNMQGHMPPPPPLQIPPPPFPPPDAPVMEHIPIKYYARPSQMKKMVETLSLALTQFGGLPPPPQEPEPVKKEVPADTLLAAFGGDEDDNDEINSDADMVDMVNKLTAEEDPDRVRPAGEEDEELTFGIQFIMNALKSWAQQRLYQTRIATWQRDWLMYQDALHARQPGDPMPQDPGNFHTRDGYIDLSSTPEGHAVTAFREVIESGCLQKNVIVPAILGGALRHLYSQIDALINQHQKPQQPWHCMSYKAQINAHATRVEKHKVHQARVQEEIARQQHESHQLVMQQMGVPLNMGSPYHHQPPPPLRQPMSGRNFSHGFQQQVPSPYGTPSGMAPSPTSFNGVHSSGQPFTVPDHPAGSRGHPPRMGAGMTFSFPPTNQAHVEAWGPQAFPAMSGENQILPNRGPMNGSPVNGQPISMRGDRTSLPSRPGSSFAKNEDPPSRRTSIKGNDAHAHPALPPSPYDPSANGFTAVNRPDSRAAAESSAGTPSAQPPKIAGKKRVSRSDSASETRSLRSGNNGARRASRLSQADPETIVVDDD